MDHCEFGSLEKYMDKMVSLNEDELREIVSCCLLGLDFLHSRHIIHSVVDR